jgi:hypothetical protein
MEIAIHLFLRTLLWVLIILTCLALIAVLVFVIGSLADQTGEASPLSPPKWAGLRGITAQSLAVDRQSTQ